MRTTWRNPILAAIGLIALMVPASAYAQVELRLTWYSDGGEGDVMRDLLNRFEQKNADVKVIMDVVAFRAINENLPVMVQSGQGPDMARVVDLGGLSKFYLDLTPHLPDPAYWHANFEPFLAWMRRPGDAAGISGVMTQLTVTGGFINKTLFDQAKIPVPGATASWEDWAKAASAVAKAAKIPMALAMDRSGHRFAPLAIDQGAKYFDAQGNPAIADAGFRKAAEMLVDWHKQGIMPKEIWAGASGTAYKGANEEFANSQLAYYYSGNWQIGQFAKQIGDTFDWTVVPEPCGPAACTGMPGGAALVAFAGTKHPKEVARVMDYFASEAVLKEFSERSLFIPAHLGLAKKPLEFRTDSRPARDALNAYAQQVAKIDKVAFQYQGYANNRLMFNATVTRLTQAITGELTLDQALQRIEADVAEGLKEKAK
ncbi:MAG: carbohydrate ABC transporter substrate-binding protein [Proteobacteria bacterium]|nr:carbohydrate ABC transporter substrate-binding protein [Pseudomonadota bacterium]MBI3496644.1 carbohydrate ABC transporter substrate-binding protein [Pseudomonadota bacterium]